MAEVNNTNNVRIPDAAKKFASATFKKFKKKNKDFYDGKKDLKNGYMYYLLDYFPETIMFIVRCGYIRRPEVQEIKEAIYAKFVDEDFIKVVKREIKEGNNIENIKLFPIIIKDILQITTRTNQELLAEDPNAKIYDLSDLIELSKLILKKKLKKGEKAGIDLDLAFDILSTIPTMDALKRSQNYRVHQFFIVLYEHAKTKVIPFKKIMEKFIEPEYYGLFIVFSLLERKEKFGSLTDAQKTFYLEVSNWTFDTMEKMSKDEIKKVLTVFVKARKRDELQGKDGNRRYVLSTLSETDYERISKVIKNMIAEDDDVKKYF